MERREGVERVERREEEGHEEGRINKKKQREEK